MLFLIFQIEAWVTRNWFLKMTCQVFDEITRVACPREIILALRIFQIFKLLLEQVTLKFTISHDSKINLGMEYEKRMLKLMVDQKSNLVNPWFYWLWLKWPIFPFWSIESFPLQIDPQFFNHKCLITCGESWKQVWVKKSEKSWLNPKP